MSNRWLIVLLSFALAACASSDKERVKDAALAPLNDLNLVQTEVPPALIEAQKQPYLVPQVSTCEALTAELKELDAVLQPDFDTPPPESQPALVELENEAKDAAVGALRSTTEGLVPFRGWVRKLSGAERNSRQIAAAIAAGTARRAFIKGFMVSKECG